MGQYYKAILLDADKKTPRFHFSSWGFNNGAKLTEHSYIGNTFMGAVEKVIADNPMPLVWGGDYEGTNMRLIGSWSRDTISVSNDVPDDFMEIIPNFVESYYKKKTIVPYTTMAMAL